MIVCEYVRNHCSFLLGLDQYYSNRGFVRDFVKERESNEAILFTVVP